MFAVLHSDINSLKSCLLHLTSQPYCKKSRSAKVKDGIITLFLRNYLVGQYSIHMIIIRVTGALNTKGSPKKLRSLLGYGFLAKLIFFGSSLLFYGN